MTINAKHLMKPLMRTNTANIGLMSLFAACPDKLAVAMVALLVTSSASTRPKTKLPIASTGLTLQSVMVLTLLAVAINVDMAMLSAKPTHLKTPIASSGLIRLCATDLTCNATVSTALKVMLIASTLLRTNPASASTG